jgi:aminoglycoside/choline kinase family phosphotransferase
MIRAMGYYMASVFRKDHLKTCLTSRFASIPTFDLLPIQSSSPDERLTHLKAWLCDQAAFGFDLDGVVPASSDASFRRYFRVPSATHGSLVVMDAPPDKETCRPFVAIAEALRDAGVTAPEVLAADFDLGFLILTDLGNTTYLDAFETADPARCRSLMNDALATLALMQRRVDHAPLPRYDRTLLLREMELFPEWYLKRHCKLDLSRSDESMLADLFTALVDSALAQPQVAVHRDYHSRNLMVLEGPRAERNPGVLDFQDAVSGAVTYDLVSLLRDAYVEWPEEEVLDYAVRFWESVRKDQPSLSGDFGEFWQGFEFMGLQRHLKVLGIFARLSHRDGKHRYLDDLPLVLKYVRQVANRYRLARPLLPLLERAAPQNLSVGYSF